MTEVVRRVAICSLLFAPALPLAGQTNTTTTTSFAQVDTIHDTPVSQQVDTYSLQLMARILGDSVLVLQCPVRGPDVSISDRRRARSARG